MELVSSLPLKVKGLSVLFSVEVTMLGASAVAIAGRAAIPNLKPPELMRKKNHILYIRRRQYIKQRSRKFTGMSLVKGLALKILHLRPKSSVIVEMDGEK